MKRLSWILIPAIAFLFLNVAVAQDRIVANKGVPIQGTITAMSPTELTIDVGGTSRTFQVNDIAKVSFAEETPELVKAKEAALNGQLEAALNDLKSIQASSLNREEVRNELEFYKAYCEAKLALSGTGNLKSATDACMAFGKSARGSFHTFELFDLLGQLAFAQSDWDGAARFYGLLAKNAPWPEYKLRSATMTGRALLAQKKFAEAQAQFDLVAGSQDAGPEATRQKLLARIGKAVCVAELGAPDQAQKVIEDIIKNQDSKDTNLFGRAYNALGVCYLKQKKNKDAKLAFLHTDLLFFSDPDAHAEALFYLAKLWSDEGKADRGVAARSLLQQRYGASRWAQGL